MKTILFSTILAAMTLSTAFPAQKAETPKAATPAPVAAASTDTKTATAPKPKVRKHVKKNTSKPAAPAAKSAVKPVPTPAVKQ